MTNTYLDQKTTKAEFDVSIVWFRRDLRLEDNPALYVACQLSRRVIPLFIWSPSEEGQFQPGRCLRWWLKGSLQSLEKQLAEQGSKLFYRESGSSVAELVDVVRQTGAKAVFFNNLYDPISIARDMEVKQLMAQQGVTCQSYNVENLYEPWEVLDKNGRPFVCLEDFWKKVNNMEVAPMPPLQAIQYIPPPPACMQFAKGQVDLQSLNLMTREEEASNRHLGRKWQPGTKGAHDLFEKFMGDSLLYFDHDRSKTDRQSTSKLSPHIHFGEISVRYMFYRLKAQEWEWRKNGLSVVNCVDYLQQMGYREYSRYIMFHFPFAHDRSLLQHLRAVPVRANHQLFKLWRQGRTGYPLIDAGMRELWSTGWAHNRIRVVVASFLVKNMLLPWQWGLKFCWDCQIDADLECDMLGWQYVGGCLADAHPFSFMIDMSREVLRYDPEGEYVRKWLPMLARLPTEWIHRPWEAPQHILDDAGVELGTMYPYPVIEVEESRELVDYAVNVINNCVIKGHSAPDQPFRPETDPRLLVRMVPDNVSMLVGESDVEDSDKQSDKFKAIQVRPKQPKQTSSEQEGTSNRLSDSNINLASGQPSSDVDVMYEDVEGILVVKPYQAISQSMGASNIIVHDKSLIQDQSASINDFFGVPQLTKDKVMEDDVDEEPETTSKLMLQIKPRKRAREDSAQDVQNPWERESVGQFVNFPLKTAKVSSGNDSNNL